MRLSFYCLLMFLLTAFAIDAQAQQPKIGCVDKAVRLQAEQLKHDLKVQGQEVYKDAMIGMTNMEPYPVAVQLEARELYQLIFVANANASKIYFELYDGTDKKIGEKKIDNKGNNNFVVYSFMPQKTDMYLVVLTQKVKGKKEICGSFSITRKSYENK